MIHQAVTQFGEGQKLLRELGAVTDNMQLTTLGKEMAALPIEPQTARMLLQAHQESVLSEMLVIAAGLSIQDPREFPTEEKKKLARCTVVLSAESQIT